MKITIITPCYNEGSTVIEFLEMTKKAIAALSHDFEIVVVDDCSSDNTLDLLKQFQLSSSKPKITILNLRFNIGHQSAIFQGLLYAQTTDSERFIVMDADGEDNPQAIKELSNYLDYDIVHVIRGKRNESIMFRLAYLFYRILFRFITGQKMNFGNYCMINRNILEVLLQNSYVHFAAFLSKQKAKKAFIISDREKRIRGKSKMKFDNLIYHAFKSLVEYADMMLLLFLKAFVVIMIFFTGSIIFVIYQKLFTTNAILGWASVLSIGLLNLALISIGFFILGVLLLNLTSRKHENFKTPIYNRI